PELPTSRREPPGQLELPAAHPARPAIQPERTASPPDRPAGRPEPPVAARGQPKRPGRYVQATFDSLGEPLREVTFVVLDLETTGGSPAVDALTTIGAGG